VVLRVWETRLIVQDLSNILSMLVTTGVALSEVGDFDTLIDLIAQTALDIGGCEGCSIYEAEGGQLLFLRTRNRVLESRGIMPPFRRITIPLNEHTIVGYASVARKTVNLPDVYNLPSDAPFHFNPSFDQMTGYKSKSILAIPMCDTHGQLIGVLQLINRVENGEVVPFPLVLEPYLRALASQFGVVLRNAKIADELRRSRIETVKQFVKASEYHDSDTGGHIERMSRYSVLLYKNVGFDERACDVMALGSMLHDVGKIATPDAVLKKPGKLTADEWEIMKRHSYNGYYMLKDAESPFLQMGATIAFGHHEKWDGSGYPNGQRGEAIPVEARVVALADVFDALCSRRCYKDSWPIERVLDTVKEGAGTHFDPALVDVFFENLDQVFEIRDSFPPDDEVQSPLAIAS
jgi:HD-GYP domain-containing protein (c-di-GMP phosphodiesterase class II)